MLLFVRQGLPPNLRNSLHQRLDVVRCNRHNFDYGVGDDMDNLFAEYGD